MGNWDGYLEHTSASNSSRPGRAAGLGCRFLTFGCGRAVGTVLLTSLLRTFCCNFILLVNYCIYCDYELAMSHVKVINGRHVSLYDIKNVGDDLAISATSFIM